MCVISTLHVWQEPYVKLYGCVSECVGERETESMSLHLYVCLLLFSSCEEILPSAAYRNWIWVKTGEWLVTSLACITMELALGNKKKKNRRMLLAGPRFFLMYASDKPTQKNSKHYLQACSLRLLPNLCQWVPTTLELSVWLAAVQSHQHGGGTAASHCLCHEMC